jgi:oligoribonuclease (3'-5' exoribonuclease)
MANEQPNLIWIDCEMTGLSLEKDVLVEIAVLVTDSDLNVIGDGVDVVIKATPEQLAGMNEFVTQMHTTSGLITNSKWHFGSRSRSPSNCIFRKCFYATRKIPIGRKFGKC